MPGLGLGLGLPFGRRGVGVGKIPVVTTGAETLTLGRVDVATGKVITIDWGDGSTNTYTDAVNGSTKTHAYAGAGSYELKITDARNIKEVDFRDAKIVSFNSSFFKACGDNLEGVSLFNTLTTPVVDSADMAHLNLSSQLYLFFSQSGTYTINSDHFKAYTLSSLLYLYFNTTSLIKTITATDFNEFTALPNVGIKMGLTSTEVDNILLGLYGAFPSKTNVGGTIDLAGNGNAAPSGTYQSQCPPTTGKEAAYELINDSCGVSANHWASITVEGGLP